MSNRQKYLLRFLPKAIYMGGALLATGCSGCSDATNAGKGPSASSTAASESSTGTPEAPADSSALPASPAAAVAAAVGPASPEYTAEVSEISEAGGQGEYGAVATFTSAAGREFEMTVEDSKSGQLLANSTVSSIRGSVYSHSVPFKHRGDLSTVVVRIVEKETGREVDRWSPE